MDNIVVPCFFFDSQCIFLNLPLTDNNLPVQLAKHKDHAYYENA